MSDFRQFLDFGFFSQKQNWLFVLIIVILRILSPDTAIASHCLLAIYSLMGFPQIVKSLFVAWLIGMMNPGMAPDIPSVSVWRYLILFSCCASSVFHSQVFLGQKSDRANVTMPTAGLGLLIIAHSFAFSLIFAVSALKAVSWLLAMCTLMAAWGGMAKWQRMQSEAFLFLGIALVGVLSLPLIGTGLGVLRNGHGFQGVLNHSQAFGPVMGICGVWAASRYLSRKNGSIVLIGLGGLSFGMVLASEARTAGLAALAGLTFAGPAVWLLTRQNFGGLLPGLRNGMIIPLLFLALLLVLIFPFDIWTYWENFIAKSGRFDVSNISEAYKMSRGHVMDEMTRNIGMYPLSGIGFGIASIPSEMFIDFDPLFGIPVGAAVEKGVLPYMVVEELGIPMAIIVMLWVIMILRKSAEGGLVPMALALTILAINMGEATLFSAGGLGLLLMNVLAWASTSEFKGANGRA